MTSRCACHAEEGPLRRDDRGRHGPAVARCRPATSVPPSRFHTVEYAGVLAVDVLACPTCQGRMKLLALVKGPPSIARCLATVGEATEVPQRSPGRGPPY